MQIVGTILIIAGSILAFIFSIQILIAAFKTSVLWGLGCLFLFIPVGIIFIIMHWDAVKKPFLRYLLSLLLIGVGFALNPPDLKAIQEAAQREIAEREAAARSTAPANP